MYVSGVCLCVCVCVCVCEVFTCSGVRPSGWLAGSRSLPCARRKLRAILESLAELMAHPTASSVFCFTPPLDLIELFFLVIVSSLGFGMSTCLPRSFR